MLNMGLKRVSFTPAQIQISESDDGKLTSDKHNFQTNIRKSTFKPTYFYFGHICASPFHHLVK
jgi:hypothetical protein